jgi:hypothetical protein
MACTFSSFSAMATISIEPSGANKCYLTALPGELRNRIYDFTTEDQRITYFPQRLEGWSNKDLRLYGIVREQPNYHALTQVCRLVRAEFSPIYARQIEVHVSHVDLEDYMVMGFPLLARGRDGKVHGSLYVDCRPTSLTSLRAAMQGYAPMRDDLRAEPTIDILPFLEHCMDLPDLRVRTGFHDTGYCAEDWVDPDNFVNTLLDVARRPGLRKWLEEEVHAIFLRWPAKFTCVIKEGDNYEWMSKWAVLGFEVNEDNGYEEEEEEEEEEEHMQARKWRDQTGLRLDGEWSPFIEFVDNYDEGNYR